jgi:hypothetical protein
VEEHSPAWHWQLRDAAGRPVIAVEGVEQRFGSRSDAETWLGEAWPDLWLAGATEAVLLAEDQPVGRPVGLRPGP